MKYPENSDRREAPLVHEPVSQYAAVCNQPMAQPEFPMTQREKNEALFRLLDEWMADESGYDERVWPIVKRALEENRSGYRRLFNG